MNSAYLFGTGKYFKTKVNLLSEFTIKALLDNKISTGELKYYENTSMKIINPCEVDDSKDKIYLMSMHFVSMWKQLMKLKVDPKRVIYPYFVKPYFQSDVIVDEMVEKIEFLEEYFTVYEKTGKRINLSTQEGWNNYLRELYIRKNTIISAVAQMEVKPISEQFGSERGTPVDRIYIEKFIRKYSNYIKGAVLEIEDAIYTHKYGKENVKHSIVMDVSNQSDKIDFNANIESGEGVQECLVDCFIITQTLMYIYDLESAAKNIVKFLKPGGVALITCSGLSQNSKRCMENYGSYFNFNTAVFEKMFKKEKVEIIDTGSFGNVKTVMAHLVGMCAEDLCENDFDYMDLSYPLIVYAVVRRND